MGVSHVGPVSMSSVFDTEVIRFILCFRDAMESFLQRLIDAVSEVGCWKGWLLLRWKTLRGDLDN
jgi:hypothetical protein